MWSPFLLFLQPISSDSFYFGTSDFLIEFVFVLRSKPANVLLQGDVPSGNYKAQLADFGVAAMTQNRNEDEDLTSETGTYRYVACNNGAPILWVYGHSNKFPHHFTNSQVDVARSD